MEHSHESDALGEIDWAGLRHHYGSAEDVPALLRRCAGPEAQDAENAVFEVENLLFHQGGWVCSAASAALPHLVRLAADPEVAVRRGVLDLVALLAAEAGQVEERFLDAGWPAAWERVLGGILDLLADPVPEIRRAAAGALAHCASPGALLLPGLSRRWRAEDDAVTRLDLVLALGQAAGRAPVGPLGQEVRALLHGLLGSPEPQLRLAAVHALAPGDPGLAASHLEPLVDAVRDPSVALWQRSAALECGATGVQAWTATLFPGPSPAFVRGLLADHPDPGQRLGALAQAGERHWDSSAPAPELLPLIAARLADTDTEVRYWAAHLLACAGPAAAPYADEVAALLDDTEVRTARTAHGETVADAALWALARMRDPRCVPTLAAWIAAGRTACFGASAQHSAANYFFPWLPGLDDMLVGLPDLAGPLLPVLRDRLTPATDVKEVGRLCAVLAAWGPVAAGAVPSLVALLADAEHWVPAAKALAEIGAVDGAVREAVSAREALAARMAEGGPDAQAAASAYWRLGGEPGPALKVLAPAATTGTYPHPALRGLAGLGAHAAAYAPALRARLSATDPWTRTEAAHALWAVTGDVEGTVPVLLDVVRDLAAGRYRPVMLTAVRHLTRMGRAARPAADLLRELPACDRRLRCFSGWRAFTEDAAIRSAVDDLLAGHAGQMA
ncbi:hypothetical protein, partial [Streptomyces flavofungini]|uniref:hypothetical protein n=1 Tax=Streptomyces flavofungini TaxID=68200 RepID=UPI0034E02EF1